MLTSVWTIFCILLATVLTLADAVSSVITRMLTAVSVASTRAYETVYNRVRNPVSGFTQILSKGPKTVSMPLNSGHVSYYLQSWTVPTIALLGVPNGVVIVGVLLAVMLAAELKK